MGKEVRKPVKVVDIPEGCIVKIFNGKVEFYKRLHMRATDEVYRCKDCIYRVRGRSTYYGDESAVCKMKPKEIGNTIKKAGTMLSRNSIIMLVCMIRFATSSSLNNCKRSRVWIVPHTAFSLLKKCERTGLRFFLYCVDKGYLCNNNNIGDKKMGKKCGKGTSPKKK